MTLFPQDDNYENVKFPPLRPFQITAHEALRQGVRDGHKNQLIMAPTGGGKTLLAHNIAHEALKRGKRVTFVCDRTTLINQTSASADALGITQHAIVQANHWRRDTSMRYQIASAQTLAKRQFWPQSDVILIDEAHSQMSVWTKHIMQTDAVCIGLSATPFSKGLGKLFSNLINATTMDELTRQGFLVPMRVLSCKRANMEGAKTSGGEWTPQAAEERGMEIIGDVVSEWLKHGENRKTIVFGSTIKHCQELTRSFLEAGVMAAMFTSETTADERAQLLAEYTKTDSTLRVLISVEALAKGFDVPDVSCVVDCRPLRKSLSTAIQMWGRGLRSSPAKADCLLLDHSGNIVRMARDYEQVYFHGLDKLDDGEKLDAEIRKEKPLEAPRGCPKCGYKPFAQRCMSCGFEIVQSSKLEFIPGTMQEVSIGGASIQRAQLWNEICSFARNTAGIKKKAGFAFIHYRRITGSAPPYDFSQAQQIAVSPEIAKNLRGQQLRGIIARKAMGPRA